MASHRPQYGPFALIVAASGNAALPACAGRFDGLAGGGMSRLPGNGASHFMQQGSPMKSRVMDGSFQHTEQTTPSSQESTVWLQMRHSCG
jgi:hypothetical protein